MSEKPKPRPRSVEAIIAAFGDDLLRGCLIKIGMTMSVVDVDVTSDNSSVQVVVTLGCPNGDEVELVMPGYPYANSDQEWPDDVAERMREWTKLTPSALRRRMHQAGFDVLPEVADPEGGEGG